MTENTSWILTAAIAAGAALITIAIAYAGFPRYLGAHPWWAHSTAAIGAGAGIVATLLLRATSLSSSVRMLVALLFLAAALYAAIWGGTTFAESYAENALAGRVWYFGWIASATASTLVLSQVAQAWWQSRNRRD